MKKDPSQLIIDPIPYLQDLYKERYATCFWFMDPNLEITQENLPIICNILKKNGNREDYILARRICP